MTQNIRHDHGVKSSISHQFLMKEMREIWFEFLRRVKDK